MLNYNPIFWECTQQYTHISQNKQKEKQTNKYRNLPLSYDMEFSNIGESSVSFIVITKCVNKISFSQIKIFQYLTNALMKRCISIQIRHK